MKQRLGIAAALLSQPELLVLDEPANGLDPAGIRDIRRLLCDLAEAGTSVLVSSHLLAELETMCDWVVLLNRGRRVYQGPVQDLVERGRGLAVRTMSAAHLAIVEDVARGHGFATSRGEDMVVVHAPAQFGGTLNEETMRRGGIISELAVHAASLEQQFFAITDEDGR